jgi:hypothetical protein
MPIQYKSSDNICIILWRIIRSKQFDLRPAKYFFDVLFCPKLNKNSKPFLHTSNPQKKINFKKPFCKLLHQKKLTSKVKI